jgi:hypothetical protein
MFSDAEKQVLDQFIINGGKTLWLVEQVNVEMDSLYNASGSTFAFPRDLNLNDMFFKYGFRINPTLSKTNKEVHKAGEGEQGSATQYQEFNGSLPIGLSGEFAPDSEKFRGIKFDFANPIDTENGIKENDTAQVLPIFQKNWHQ